MRTLIIAILFSIAFISCNKSDDYGNETCYDKSIVHNDVCTTDCPGIVGCDNKTYCNECEAARVGIRPK
jgi:hypothetical protein